MTSRTTAGTAGDKAERVALNNAGKALRTGDAAPARTLLATTRTDPDRRAHHVGELSKAGAKQLGLLGGLLEAHPGDPGLLLLLGAALVTAAGEARGSAVASALSGDPGSDREWRAVFAEVAKGDRVPRRLLRRSCEAVRRSPRRRRARPENLKRGRNCSP